MVTSQAASQRPSLAEESAFARLRHSRWFVIFVILLAVTIAFFDRINISVLFTDVPFLRTLGIQGKPALMGLLMTAFIFPYALSQFFLSFLTDVIGPRRTLALITVVLAVTMGYMGAVSSFAMMLAGRVILGVAEGPQWGANNVVVKRWFPPNEQSFASSCWTIGSPLGSAVGFPLVLLVVAHYGWRGSFYILAALNAVILLPVILLFVRDYPLSSAVKREDVLVRPSNVAQDDSSVLKDLRLLMRDWKFWMVAIYECGALMYLWGLNSWLVAYLRVFRHFDITRAGIYTALPFILICIGSLLGSRIADRFQCRAIFAFAGLFLAGVCVLLAATSASALAAARILALSAFFWGWTQPTIFAIGLQVIPTKITATGFGIYAGISNTAGATAPLIMGAVIGSAGHYNRGLAVMVLSCLVLSCSVIPFLRRY